MNRYRFELILSTVLRAALLANCSFVSTPTLTRAGRDVHEDSTQNARKEVHR